MYRIFIVEDEKNIAGSIKKSLENWDMKVKTAENFKDILPEFADFSPHLVILDISLPFMDGYFWCRKIRQISKVPIIFVSSASENMNIIMAVNMGADDFVSKPFDINVLIAKINALLRRTYDFASSVSMLQCRGAVLNTEDGSLFFKDEKIELTKNEYKILLTLMQNKGKTVSREDLMDALWQSYEFVDDNSLSVNVGRLRKKLENAGLGDFIKTKFKEGYIVSED